MANPTTNFGWQMPTSTDLVTDLPADFEVFGQAVDTALVDLKGGTTGQVLSKTSGTDMDFTWVTTDDANAIQNAIVDAKGDLIAASAADTPARLAVGNNGETLVADSSTSTGLRYQGSMAAGKNFIINGGMDIWQRGTSIALTSANTYCVDRFIASANTSGAATVSRQVTGDTTNLPFVQYCARFQRNSGNTATGIHYFNQPIETINSIPLAGKTVTVSFYARAGANFSSSGNVLTATLISGTGTDQSYLVAWTGTATVATTNATLTTTWQRFQFTGTVATTATELTLPFQYTPTGTAGANDYYEVTGVQLEVGSIATQFSRAGATIQGELAACQRYYQRFSGSAVSSGFASSTSVAQFVLNHKVSLRSATVTLGQFTMGAWDVTSFYTGGTWAVAQSNVDAFGIGFTRVTYTHTSAALTQFRPYLLQNSDANSWIEVSVEL